MRITNAAMSFISIPSPKGNPFREGPKKEKRKSRSLRKVFSPIRKMGKQFSKLSNKIGPKAEKGASKTLQEPDIEQGWIAPATTFETEDTLSPRSFDSLTTSDSTQLLVQTTEKEEEITFFSVTNPSHQTNDDEYLDLEAGINESANTSTIFRMDIDVRNVTEEIEFDENITEEYEAPNAAPHVEPEDFQSEDVQEIAGEYPPLQDIDVVEEPSIGNYQEETRESMESLLTRIDTTEVIIEGDEIDSLLPAADISFFLNEEDDDDFHCVGRLSTPQKEVPPVEIDVDSDEELSNSPTSSEKSPELYIEEDDDISFASYNSYLQAIESATASANSQVDGVASMAMEELEIETPSYSPRRIEYKIDLTPVPDVQIVGEKDGYRVSFNPSRELLLQAMEGASVKAKADIERAAALALSKMNSAKPVSLKRNSMSAPNRILGFLFFVLLLFQFNGNSFQFLRGIKSISQSVGVDQFQLQAHNEITLMEPNLDQAMWGETRENETDIAVTNEHYFYNVGCINKLGCLALGNL
eukprot:CAMPEP_0116144430 /NCGR_PEP_ID=MMETSP0329-20121206/16002_1 /TAXON_ID=697910 /ORGANISM="Pseudo-nitzschia arenysensis, Strain B593" /LENGTH=526 /DNA_ID=CAMNT_0003639861 /DNA_START=112 /DNA_END=1692 /DNA_ORIENTATION=-